VPTGSLERSRIPVVAALAAVVVVGGPFLFGDGVDIPDDALYYIVPGWAWLRTAVETGQSIWFVPGKLGGASLYGDVTAMGPLYPACWLTLLMPVIPALGIASFGHAIATVFAVRWMAMVFGARPLSSTMAGAAVVVGPLGLAAFQDCQVDSWPTFLWLPVVLASLERLADASPDRRRRWIALGGAALALLLLGSHLRLAAASCGLIGLWVLIRGRDLRGAVSVCALGVLAGAPGFIPMLLEVAGASEGTGDINKFSQPIDQALGWAALPGLLAPSLFVDSRDVALCTVLGVGLIASYARGNSRDRRLALCVVVLVFAGTHTPGIQYILAPLVALSHPVNLVYPALAVIPAAALAARGVDRLIAMTPATSSSWLQGREALLLGGLVALVLLRSGMGPSAYASPYAWKQQLFGAGQAVLVVALLSAVLLKAKRLPHRGMLIFGLCLVDLCVFAIRGHIAIPSETLTSPLESVQGDTQLLSEGYLDILDLSRGYDSTLQHDLEEDEEWVQRLAEAQNGSAPQPDPSDEDKADAGSGDDDDSGNDGVTWVDQVVVAERDAPAIQQDLLHREWPPHLGVALGVRGLAGRSKLAPGRQIDALKPLAEALQDVEPSRDVLGTLFGRAIGETGPISEYNDDVTCGFRFCDGVGTRSLGLQGIGIAVWEDHMSFPVPDQAPLCYSPGSLELVSDLDERLERLLTRRFQPGGPGLIESPVAGVDEATARTGLVRSSVSCTEAGVIEVQSTGTTAVALRQRWHDGWQLRDQSGAKIPTFPLNQVHLGVLLDPGQHRLTYSFIPPGLVPSGIVAILAWLVMLGLSWRRRATPAGRRSTGSGLSILALAATATLVLGSSSTAQAETIGGTVLGWSPDADYEVWLTTSLDLSRADQPRVRAEVEPRTGRFQLNWDPRDKSAEDEGQWLFLYQRIDQQGQAPLTFHRPYDLTGLPHDKWTSSLTLRAVPPDMAILRHRGEPMPQAWITALALTLFLYGTGLLLRWLMALRIATITGARALLAVSRGEDLDDPAWTGIARAHKEGEASRVRGPEPSPPTPSAGTRERLALLVLLLIALGLRLPGFTSSPIELLEYTYGPGSNPIVEDIEEAPNLLDHLIRPSSLEVTHPPIYHWLLGALGALSSGEWILRVPALIASLLSIVLCWMLFRRFSVATGLVAAGGLAVVAPAVHFGADATPYALVAAIALGSLLALLRALESGDRRMWLLWTTILAFGGLCHYSVAPIAFAQAAVLATMVVLRIRKRSWLRHGREAIFAVLALAPIPLLWSILHFGYFPPVALDTRLFADTYPRDPGLLRFLAEFTAIGTGVSPDDLLQGAALLLLSTLGLSTAIRTHRTLGNLLLGMLAAFVGGTVFFHGNLVHHLDGRVFYGFRWVTWLLPIVLGLGALGLVQLVGGAKGGPPARPGPRMVGIVLATLWASAALPFTSSLRDHTTRPDYHGAAQQILADMADRDAVATLPLWAQRGPLTWYLNRAGNGTFEESEDTLTWNFSGNRVFLEAIDEDLPFQSSARNGHFTRLWVAVPDERMFGRRKFSMAVADAALLWAEEHLIPDGTWDFEHMKLHRFRRKSDDLRFTGVGRLKIAPPELELSSQPYQEPNTPACSEQWEETGDQDDPQFHWRLNLRVPLKAGEPTPSYRVEAGEVSLRHDPHHWAGLVEGGPCSEPAPTLWLEAAREPQTIPGPRPQEVERP